VENSKKEVLSGSGALVRELGKLQGYATLIGVLIGSGIFVVIGTAGGMTGPSVPLSFLALYPVILSTAMAYMVFLSTPLGERPGGAYLHIQETFGKTYPAFIAVWFQWIAFMGALGVLSLSFGEYATFFVKKANPVAVACGILLLFYLVNLVGVRYYGNVQTVMCFVLLVSIVILVVPGLFHVKISNYRPLFPFGLKGFLGSLAPLFMSYAGFEALAQAAGETREARKTLPMVFFKGISLTVAIYVIMAFVAFGVLPYGELARSKSAMADVAATYLPFGAAGIVALGALMAFTTSINATLMAPPRVLLVLAEDGVIPPVLSRVHPKFHTPHVALTISTLVALALLLTKTLDYILAVTLQSIFILYIIHGVALIALPFINKKLYDSALFRPRRLLIVVCGLFSVCCMIAFSYKMLIQTWPLILLCAVVGTGVFIYGMARNFRGERVLKGAEKS